MAGHEVVVLWGSDLHNKLDQDVFKGKLPEDRMTKLLTKFDEVGINDVDDLKEPGIFEEKYVEEILKPVEFKKLMTFIIPQGLGAKFKSIDAETKIFGFGTDSCLAIVNGKNASRANQKEGVLSDEFVKHSIRDLKASLPPQYDQREVAGVDERQYYKMNRKKRGYFVIFNYKVFEQDHLTRKGTDIDALNLAKTGLRLGFEDVVILNSLTFDETSQAIKIFSSSSHSERDCFVCCILTHGDKGELLTYNGLMDNVKFFSAFAADECRTLSGKPKIFIMQACRGTRRESGAPVSLDSLTFPTEQPSIPTQADFLFCYSTAEDFVSNRRPDTGSPYINELCEKLSQSFNTEIMEVIQKVNSAMACGREEGSAENTGKTTKKHRLSAHQKASFPP